MPSLARRWELACLALILILFGLYLAFYVKPVFWHVDPDAYYGAAVRLAESGSFAKHTADDFEFVGRQWVRVGEDRYWPKYPPFYPAIAAGAIALAGKSPALYLNAVLALLAVFGAYLLARGLGLGSWSLLVAFVVATNPVLGFWAIRHVSHSASVAVLTWGFVALGFGWISGPGVRRTALFALAGLAVGVATGIRYTNLLLALPLLLAGLASWRGGGRKETVGLLLGLAVPGAVLAGYHWLAFGSPLATAYSATGEQSAFGWDSFATNWRMYANGILRTGLGPLVLLFVLGLVFRLRDREARPGGLFYLAWLGPLTLLMLFYVGGFEERQMSFLRFLLPLLVPAALLMVAVARELLRRLEAGPGAARGLVAGMVLVQGIWGGFLTLDYAEKWRHRSVIQQHSIREIRQAVPAGSVIFANRQLLAFLDYGGEYELYDAGLFRRRELAKLVERATGPRPPAMPLDRLETIRTELLDVSRAEALGRLGDLVRSHRQAGRRVYLVDSSKRVRKLLEGIRRHWKTRKPRKVERRVAPYLLVPSMTAVVLSKKAVREQVDLWIVEIEKVKGGSG